MPTAELVEKNHVDLDLYVATDEVNPQVTTGFEVGLSSLEFGYDAFRFEGVDTYAFNAKQALLWRKDDPVLAVGYQNVGDELQAQPYLVGRVPLAMTWLHAGFIQIDRVVEPMVGWSYDLNEDVRVMVDYIPGRPNQSSVGFWAGVGDYWYINGAYVRLNSGSDRDQFFIGLDYVFPFRKS